MTRTTGHRQLAIAIATLLLATGCSRTAQEMANAEAAANATAPGAPMRVPRETGGAERTAAPASSSGTPTPAATLPDQPAAAGPVAMCSGDYCPCDPPQSGPDVILCDQVRHGVDPGAKAMALGRDLRAQYRQGLDRQGVGNSS